MTGRRRYPTELIGSYALPGWLIALEERAESAGDLGEADIAEAPDCGFNHCPRHVARAKLRALTAGARLARQRGGGDT